jgi:hypothetical protein
MGMVVRQRIGIGNDGSDGSCRFGRIGTLGVDVGVAELCVRVE